MNHITALKGYSRISIHRNIGTCFRNGLGNVACRSVSSQATIDADPKLADKFRDAKPFSSIPYAGSKSWVLNILEIFLTKGGFHKSVYKIQERDYGSIARRASPQGDEVWLFDPQDVATVFRADSKYPRRFDIPLLDDFYARRSKEPGVFFLNGDKWHKPRILLSKKMLRPLEVNQYIPRINCIASEMVERISKVRDSETFEVDEIDMELFKWSFETVAEFLFDRRFYALSDSPPERATNFIKAVGRFLDSFSSAYLMPPGLYKYYKTKAFKDFDHNFMLLYKFAEELIEEKLTDIAKRRERGEDIDTRNELIPFLLSSDRISEDEVGSSIVDTLFAGVDTTSNTMQWMLYLIAKNPHAQSRIREEISRVLPQGQEPTAESLQQLSLVKAAVKETLRLYPVLIITARTLEHDVVLSGYHVPANTRIFLMHHVMGRSEDLFENAQEFVPERWLRTEAATKHSAYASIPFGHGVRMCLGRRLSELELQILLIKILNRYTLEIPPGHVVDNYFRSVNIPDKPIRVKFVERKTDQR
ncbi:1,25-dihydroxyvitamin D(3) 24-hydroxylase, mitochondrial-like [Rhopilema esculentum]|uniref:1,25-dihydroxyvitamin D(3) 24-hydroxylase, mitochondrial-like n=1 Tax=Rhopilema esculentum TaxID=499914 RepID=UPI0031D22313|eukprot:gene5598-10803_t